jgi:hypothetical protein
LYLPYFIYQNQSSIFAPKEDGAKPLSEMFGLALGKVSDVLWCIGLAGGRSVGVDKDLHKAQINVKMD